MNLHFLHIGKTGGSAIRYALKGVNSGSKKIHFYPHNKGLNNIPVGEKIVFFLRDPFSRFESGFYSRQRQGRPKYFYKWSKEEEKAFSIFKTPVELVRSAADQSCPLNSNAIEALNSIGHVKSHYSDRLVSLDYLTERLDDLFFVGFQETLSDDFQDLVRRIDIKEAIELPTDDVIAHRSPSYSPMSLTPKEEQFLFHWFAEDYRFIEYCKQIKKLTLKHS